MGSCSKEQCDGVPTGSTAPDVAVALLCAIGSSSTQSNNRLPLSTPFDAGQSGEAPARGTLQDAGVQGASSLGNRAIVGDAQVSLTDAGVNEPQAIRQGASLDLNNPELDFDLAFLAQDGFESVHFAVACHSVDPNGARLDEEPLWVGEGDSLECETANLRSQSTQIVFSSANELFCVLGVMDTFYGDGDDRLNFTIRVRSKFW